jgi:haloacetate dehalogenase
MSELFPGFAEKTIEGDGADLFVRTGGSGNPLLLIHGFPQTGAMWRKMAQQLAEHFFVVIPDLRGYGRSSKPANTADNLPYSKRAMADDLIAVMERLGHGRFAVAGHDRGGRVAYRMALDHHAQVETLVTLDIVPTIEQWRALATITGALKTYHWPFLAQAYPLPEQMINANPDFYLEQKLGAWNAGKGLAVFDPAALAEYRSFFRNPAVVHAMCNDYRAGATCDVAHDKAAEDENRKITAPMLALWGAAGIPGETGPGPLEIWRKWAENVSGLAINCGHFLPEEAPDETLAAMLPFLQGLHA